MSQLTSPPSYAPTATTSFTPSNQTGYHTEVTRSSIIKSPLHKNVYESLAEIFSILPTLEMLENSFLKDYVTDKDRFTATSYRLINQYQLIVKGFLGDDVVKVLSDVVAPLTPDLLNFLAVFTQKFHLQCPLAVKRLQVGIPATIEHLNVHVDSSSHPGAANIAAPSAAVPATSTSARLVAEITGNFITCMDALKLNYKTKDQLHPLLSDLVVNLNDLIDGNHKMIDFQGKSKLVNWLIRLNNLGDEKLDEGESEQFLEDLDVAYKGFYSELE